MKTHLVVASSILCAGFFFYCFTRSSFSSLAPTTRCEDTKIMPTLAEGHIDTKTTIYTPKSQQEQAAAPYNPKRSRDEQILKYLTSPLNGLHISKNKIRRILDIYISIDESREDIRSIARENKLTPHQISILEQKTQQDAFASLAEDTSPELLAKIVQIYADQGSYAKVIDYFAPIFTKSSLSLNDEQVYRLGRDYGLIIRDLVRNNIELFKTPNNKGIDSIIEKRLMPSAREYLTYEQVTILEGAIR